MLININYVVRIASYPSSHYIDQGGKLAPKNDKVIEKILRDYYKRNITNRVTLSELLRVEHNITMSYVLLFCWY